MGGYNDLTTIHGRVFCIYAFGKKPDLTSETEIDFDHIYKTAIKPAIEDAGLERARKRKANRGKLFSVSDSF